MGKFTGGVPSVASQVQQKFGVSGGGLTGGIDRGPKVRTTGTAAPSKSSAKVGNRAGSSSGGPSGTKGGAFGMGRK